MSKTNFLLSVFDTEQKCDIINTYNDTLEATVEELLSYYYSDVRFNSYVYKIIDADNRIILNCCTDEIKDWLQSFIFDQLVTFTKAERLVDQLTSEHSNNTAENSPESLSNALSYIEMNKLSQSEIGSDTEKITSQIEGFSEYLDSCTNFTPEQYKELQNSYLKNASKTVQYAV